MRLSVPAKRQAGHERQVSEKKPAEAVFEWMGAYANDLERTSPPVFVG